LRQDQARREEFLLPPEPRDRSAPARPSRAPEQSRRPSDPPRESRGREHTTESATRRQAPPRRSDQPSGGETPPDGEPPRRLDPPRREDSPGLTRTGKDAGGETGDPSETGFGTIDGADGEADLKGAAPTPASGTAVPDEIVAAEAQARGKSAEGALDAEPALGESVPAQVATTTEQAAVFPSTSPAPDQQQSMTPSDRSASVDGVGAIGTKETSAREAPARAEAAGQNLGTEAPADARKETSASEAGPNALPAVKTDAEAAATAKGDHEAKPAKADQAWLGSPPVPSPAPSRPVPADAPVPNSPIRIVSEVPLGAVPVEIGLKSLAGINHFEIRLDPLELGRIEVRLEIDTEGDVKAHLSVDRVETLALLQRDAKTLERAFDQAGLRLSDGGVELSLRDQQTQGQGRHEHAGEQRRDGSRQAAPDKPHDVAERIPAEPPRRHWRGAAGIDVRI
jgi:flagellar hook-length control protein FliK